MRADLLRDKAKIFLERATGKKSEYWFGYIRAIYDIFPELEGED
jgi:hypothetical protein